MMTTERQFYTKSEKDLLADLISQERQHLAKSFGMAGETIESKKVNLPWGKILDQFNALNPILLQRDIKQLKGMWKSIARSESSAVSKMENKPDVDVLIQSEKADYATDEDKPSLRLKLKRKNETVAQFTTEGKDEKSCKVANINVGEYAYVDKIRGALIKATSPPPSPAKSSQPPKKCYSREEKLLFLQEMTNRVKIIESKKYNWETSLQKNASWGELTLSFNAHTAEPGRTVKQLKSLWKTMKDKAKNALARSLQRENVGWVDVGRLPSDKVVDPVLKRVCEIIASLTDEREEEEEEHNKIRVNGSPPSGNFDSFKRVTTTGIFSPGQELEESSQNMHQVGDDDPLYTGEQQMNLVLLCQSPKSQRSSSDQDSEKADAPTHSPSSTDLIISESDQTNLVDNTSFNQGLFEQSLQFQDRLIKMAYAEHEQRMKVMKAEEEVLIMKKKKLEWKLENMMVKH